MNKFTKSSFLNKRSDNKSPSRHANNSTKVFNAWAWRNDRSNLHGTSKNRFLSGHSLSKLILLSICTDFVIFSIVQSTALRFVPFLPSFSAIFYEASATCIRNKRTFSSASRSRRRTNETRLSRCDERVIKTKYGSELMIILFAVFLSFRCNF